MQDSYFDMHTYLFMQSESESRTRCRVRLFARFRMRTDKGVLQKGPG